MRFSLILLGLKLGSVGAIALGAVGGGAIAALEPWGLGEGLTPEQAAAVPYLAWPQSYEAMVDLLGYPDARDESADWYKFSHQWVIVHYSGATATGYEWRD